MTPMWAFITGAAFGSVVASIFWIAYAVFRMQELQAQHEEDKAQMREEHRKEAKMVRKVELQGRVFGQHRVADLIGDTEDVVPVVVNPEAIGDPDQTPIVELPAGFADLFGIGGGHEPR